MQVLEAIGFLLLGIFIGYLVACILRAAKEADEKINKNSEKQLVPGTYFRLDDLTTIKTINNLKDKIKAEQLKVAFYIKIIYQIEDELKKQQFNSVVNLTNKIKSIISQSYEDILNKRKELINDDRNEND